MRSSAISRRFYFDTSCKDLYQTLKLGATCVILEKKFFALPLFLLQALDRRRRDRRELGDVRIPSGGKLRRA